MSLHEVKSTALSVRSDHIEDARGDVEKRPEKQVNDAASRDPSNPMNWPQWKKNVNLALISFHALMTNFVGAGIIPVYTTFAEMFGVSVQDISYFTSIHILCTGITPFILVPISNRYGRRPIWLVSTLCTLASNIGCAKSSSYGAMMVCRVIGSVFLGAPIALGPPVVVETFQPHERGLKMGIWSVLVTLGPPFGPFIMGFVAQRAGWEWVYWTFAITSGVQFILYFFFSPETRYIPPTTVSSTEPKSNSWVKQYLSLHRIDSTPFSLREAAKPFQMARYITVLIPIYAHTMIFNLSAAMLTVEIPQLFGARFEFNAQQIGMQFLGIIVGTLVGELFNAIVLQFLRKRAAKRAGEATVDASGYLFASYLGFVCMIIGLVIFCILLGRTEPMHYNVGPIIGIGIAGFGNQLVASFLINYVIQMHHENASSVSVLLGFLRQTWCFIGPFWFPPMFENLGFEKTSGLLVALVVISVLPLGWMHWRYRRVK